VSALRFRTRSGKRIKSFVKSQPGGGYKPRKNGDYYFRPPLITDKTRRLPILDKKRLLFNFGKTANSHASAAKEFGVGTTTVRRWHGLIERLYKERPTVAKTLLMDHAGRKVLARDYYESGGNKFRLHYGLTNVGARGAIVVLAVFGYIKESREDLARRALKTGDNYKTLVERTVNSVIGES